MFLRQIQIRGFKSFADKTVLEFIPGTSVIVGPNGSGKSNLVDAISWVLGEQGARALRGGHMADVIFAGTPSRPALGMAEVKLVIDNSAGKIPVPMSEIEVSRTIFRSGESEYRINAQLVRLLDVQELLSETGIGRALHTVVGQGQLEEVLLSRPEERRQYIEEAAGIAKHRRRKERAQRKLAGLDQDLLRLQDVMTELKRQLRPLKQQAEMAERHEALTTQASELAWRLAASRLRGLYADRARRRTGSGRGGPEGHRRVAGGTRTRAGRRRGGLRRRAGGAARGRGRAAAARGARRRPPRRGRDHAAFAAVLGARTRPPAGHAGPGHRTRRPRRTRTLGAGGPDRGARRGGDPARRAPRRPRARSAGPGGGGVRAARGDPLPGAAPRRGRFGTPWCSNTAGTPWRRRPAATAPCSLSPAPMRTSWVRRSPGNARCSTW